MAVFVDVIPRAKMQTATILDDMTISSLLDDAEDEMRAELDGYGLELDESSSDLRVCARNWLCRNIYRRHKHDGTMPNSLNVGNRSESATIDATIQEFDVKGRDALDRFLSNSMNGDASDDCLFMLTGGV